MKKVVFLLVILLAVTGAMFAQGAESILGNIPAATYTKSDDNASWTFAATGITIRDENGSITIPAREMRNLQAITDSGSVGLSFAFDTEENQRTYRVLYNPVARSSSIVITKNGETLPSATLKR